MALSRAASLAVRDLEQFSEEELATICRTVLTGKENVIRDIVDWAVPDIIFGPAKAITDGRQTGVIKSYNDAKGFGFITSPEIMKAFGKDIFVSSHQMMGFPVGAEVSFAVLLNKGKEQAFDLAFLHEPRGSAARRGINEGDAKGRTARADEIGKGKRGRPEDEMFLDGKGWPAGMKGFPDGMFWPEGKGWGMGWGLPCQGWSEPWHSFESKGSSVGKHPSGKDRYHNSRPRSRETQVGHHVDGLTDRRFYGRVKSYGKKYGYGFIVSDELKDRFDKDIFAHAHELERLTKDLEETIGRDVIFSVTLTEDDKPIAIDIEYDDFADAPNKRARVSRDDL